MLTSAIRVASLLLLSLVLFACGDKAPRMDIEVNVTLNGKLLPNTKVLMDGKLLGETDASGQFNASMKELPGKQLKVEALAVVPGYEIQPWKSEFTVKLPNDGEILKYVFDVELQATPYVVFAVREKGVPVAGAKIVIDSQEVGNTDDSGAFTYKYRASDKQQSAAVEVSKSGYATWKKSAKLEPGYQVGVDLLKQMAVNFEALRDEYGRDAGIAGIEILVNGKRVGKTNDIGVLMFNHENPTGKPVKVTYSAPGFLPAEWSTNMVLEGGTTVRHYFYPVSVKPIKVAFIPFAGNTPGVDLKDVVTQTQSAIRTQLLKHSVFHEVAGTALDKEIKSSNLSVAKMTSKGWQQTRLQGLVDMIVVGSVAKDPKGYIIESKFHSSGGKLIYSQVIQIEDRSDINGAAKDIATNVIERFPFEGTVIALKDDRYEINLGKQYAISRGTEFALMPSASSKASASSSLFTVKSVGDASSFAILEDAQSATKIAVGDRVVRRVQHEGESSGGNGGRETMTLLIKGGAAKDASPLAGVNIYLNNDWVGSTGTDGRANIAMRTGKNFNLMLYRHGYKQIAEKVKTEKSGDVKSYVMSANYSLFKAESTPVNASVYVDRELLGKTPMLEGKQVTLGFHTVRVTAGDVYRDWEAVIEFDKKTEDRTGPHKFVLYKDYVKIGEAAEAKGDIDAAIAAYAATVRGHPDYSEAHHRLAQLYLDEKDDFNGAIKEFENVLSLPENEQLIHKQYAVAYTNLGHAYYEKGNNKMAENRNDAAQYYSKAVQNLKVARQNTRFFPAAEYDQAEHDTYFYLALSYQKLYMISNRSNMLSDANLAWRDYFDFFPRKLEGDPVFIEHRETARKFWNQIKDKN